LAGEIATTYKNKQITLVHSEESLLNSRFPKKLRDTLANQLRDLNVKLVLGERIDLTTKKTIIESDIQFVVTGAKPNTEIIKSFDASLLEPHTNLVRVKPTLQLDKDIYDNIFAVGDVTNVQESKMAFRAGLHGQVVVKNVLAKINNKKMNNYNPMGETAFIPIGKNKGAGLLPMFGGKVVGSFMVKKIKGKNLLVDQTWKSLNAKRED
ncbi:12322_t:CDS:2, partial [Acaulospora colombiana]